MFNLISRSDCVFTEAAFNTAELGNSGRLESFRNWVLNCEMNFELN